MGSDEKDKTNKSKSKGKSKYNEDDYFKQKYLKYKAKYMKELNIQKGGNQEQQITDHSSDLNNWTNKQESGPVSVYSKLVAKYGKPQVLDNSAGGLCIWRENIDFHEELWLRDEYIEHVAPAPHRDYFYSFIKVYIPPEKLCDTVKISGSITYDPLKKLLRARCQSIAANLATFRTVFELLNDETIDYGKNIGKKDEEIQSNEEYVREQIKINNDKYKKLIKQPFYFTPENK